MENQIMVSPNQIQASGQSSTILAHYTGAALLILATAGAIKLLSSNE